MRFTLKQMQYFILVAEHGSVTKAAARANVSQPSVSAALSQLEQTFATRLFVRHHARGLTMTPAGRQLAAQTKRFLAQADNLEHFAGSLTTGLGGRLDIACLLTLAPLVLPSVISTLKLDYPGVKLKCRELDIRGILSGLRDGEYELAVTYDLNLEEDIEFTPVGTFPPYAIFPPEHPLAGKGEVRLADLHGQPMVLLDLPRTRDYFRSVFSQHGVEPEIVYRTRSPTMVMGLVAGGLGFSLLNARPKTQQALGGGTYKIAELTDELPPLTMGIAELKSHNRSRAAETFMAEFTRHQAG